MNNENQVVMSIPSTEEREVIAMDKDLALVLAEAEKKVDILKKVLGVAIKRTNPKDWVDQNGHPYLVAAGAEKIAPVFGVKMEGVVNNRLEREDSKGKYYIYTFQARFFWQGGDIEAIGTCSSRDKFFAWNSKEQTFKELHEVDETNIMKAAYSNLTVNGITRVLGIRNLTWADLEPFGIDKNAVAKVEYQKGTSGGAVNSDTISEPQQKRLYAICKNVGWQEAEFKAWLLATYKYANSKDIKRSEYDGICKAAVEKMGGVYESK